MQISNRSVTWSRENLFTLISKLSCGHIIIINILTCFDFNEVPQYNCDRQLSFRVGRRPLMHPCGCLFSGWSLKQESDVSSRRMKDAIRRFHDITSDGLVDFRSPTSPFLLHFIVWWNIEPQSKYRQSSWIYIIAFENAAMLPWRNWSTLL